MLLSHSQPHLAAVKTVCGVFCGLADNVALQTEIDASSQRGHTSRRSFVVFIAEQAKKVHVEGRTDTDRIGTNHISRVAAAAPQSWRVCSLNFPCLDQGCLPTAIPGVWERQRLQYIRDKMLTSCITACLDFAFCWQKINEKKWICLFFVVVLFTQIFNVSVRWTFICAQFCNKCH